MGPGHKSIRSTATIKLLTAMTGGEYIITEYKIPPAELEAEIWIEPLLLPKQTSCVTKADAFIAEEKEVGK